VNKISPAVKDRDCRLGIKALGQDEKVARKAFPAARHRMKEFSWLREFSISQSVEGVGEDGVAGMG
jgi:hypothetical protein